MTLQWRVSTLTDFSRGVVIGGPVLVRFSLTSGHRALRCKSFDNRALRCKSFDRGGGSGARGGHRASQVASEGPSPGGPMRPREIDPPGIFDGARKGGPTGQNSLGGGGRPADGWPRDGWRAPRAARLAWRACSPRCSSRWRSSRPPPPTAPARAPAARRGSARTTTAASTPPRARSRAPSARTWASTCAAASRRSTAGGPRMRSAAPATRRRAASTPRSMWATSRSRASV